MNTFKYMESLTDEQLKTVVKKKNDHSEATIFAAQEELFKREKAKTSNS